MGQTTPVPRKLSAEHRVVLVERNAEHAFAPSFLWLMTVAAAQAAGHPAGSLPKLLQRGVEFDFTGVWRDSISPRQQVATTTGNIGYDYLVVHSAQNLRRKPCPPEGRRGDVLHILKGLRA